MSLLLPVLQPHDCQECQRCCKFEPDELVDAPTFSEEIKAKILASIAPQAEFIQRGNLWQIVLEPIPGSHKFICPVLDNATGCRLGEERPFDCITWPFYIMKAHGEVLITLSPSCPVVNERSVLELREIVTGRLASFMLDAARQNPELVTEYHDNATILAVLGPFTTLIETHHEKSKS